MTYQIACSALGRPCANLSKDRTVVVDARLQDHGYGNCVVQLRDGNGKTVATYTISERPQEISRVYRLNELEELKPIIQSARELWRKRVAEFEQSGRHPGSCVAGAGIQAYTLLKRERIPKLRRIINAPSHLQGSCSWEESLGEVLAYLRRNGVDCRYKVGCLD